MGGESEDWKYRGDVVESHVFVFTRSSEPVPCTQYIDMCVMDVEVRKNGYSVLEGCKRLATSRA